MKAGAVVDPDIKSNCMRRHYLLFLLFVAVALRGYCQTEFTDKFDDDVLGSQWQVTGPTFSLAESNNVLNVAYNRSGSEDTKWDQFRLEGISISIDDHPYISIDIKSPVAFQLAVKPVSLQGDDWLTVNVPGDNTFHSYILTVNAAVGAPVTNVYFYFDGGSTAPKAADVVIDNFVLGFAYAPPVETSYLEEAITSAYKLEAHIVEAGGDGEFPAGSKSAIITAAGAAELVLNDDAATQQQVDAATNELYDALMTVESTVIRSGSNLIDTKATKETLNLFRNLQYLSTQNKYLFGMHDATAYGINQGGASWYDDGSASKSDIQQICGSHPALFSQDVYDIVEKSVSELTSYRHRQTTAYGAGGVITLVWHMGDPVYGKFNYSDLNPSYNVVQTIIPDGVHHEWYKNELKKLAHYAKGLRGVNGEAIPVIFRPFHEHNGNWFWWGRTRCTTDQYNTLWRFTVEYLRDELNVHNFIYAFSPDGNQYNTKAEYLSIYPGDTYTDIFGLDYYFGEGNTAARDRLRDRLVHIVEYADSKDKLAALTEFGDRLGWDDTDKIEINKFYTTMVLDAIRATSKSNRIGFLATWRNANPNHHFAPYPGHKEVPDFLKFYNEPNTIFLNDVPELYSALLSDETTVAAGKEVFVFDVYPNPLSQKVMLKSPAIIQSISVNDAAGNLIVRLDNVDQEVYEVDFSLIGNGLYTIKIFTRQGTAVRKLIKK